MIRLALRLAAVLTAILPLAAHADDGAVVLIYHRFGEAQHPSTSVTLTQFERQLAAIRDGGYTVLPLPELVRMLADGTPVPSRSVAITIDDAYVSTVTEAWPRLRAHGYPFTLFVSTDAADAGTGDLMSWDQIRAMAADPLVTIGHHGAAHAHMAALSMAEAAADLDRADQRFRSELGHVPALFAYPYGEYGAALRAMVAARGFTAAFGQHSGVADRWTDRFVLPRFALNAGTSHEDFLLRLAAMPLPAEEVQPAETLVPEGTVPPLLSFRLVEPSDEGGPLRPEALNCFLDGSPLVVSVAGDRVTAPLPASFRPGRTRLNCTMPAAGGRFRWLGMQFYRPPA
jgi:peptidoglycan/xylan/chitin deacetylase (PgdA/CDA1 family)